MAQQAAHTASPAGLRVAVVGGGPAGLMAAQQLALAGVQVDLYDAMPSVGRKFLLAGRGGMNITHAEPYAQFVTRYGASTAPLRPMLDAFGPQAVRDWVHGLGLETFVGTSGRVFPTDMKQRRCCARGCTVRVAGVQFHMRHRWLGWRDGALLLQGPEGDVLVQADAVVLALGGGSWARLGSDGAGCRCWPGTAWLWRAGAGQLRLRCGLERVFQQRHAGEPLMTVAIAVRRRAMAYRKASLW
jgi:predicted flavoprotein YhiN